jgi:hypothetical protein
LRCHRGAYPFLDATVRDCTALHISDIGCALCMAECRIIAA